MIYYKFPQQLLSGQKPKVIIYGYGVVGKQYERQVRSSKTIQLVAIVDERYEHINLKHVRNPKTAIKMDYDYIIIANANKDMAEEIRSNLNNMGCHGIIYENISFEYDGSELFSLSANGEDLYIMTLFNMMNIVCPSYIDIGAYHPYIWSNTALMHIKGSHGINIEANPNGIELFEKARPSDININVGVSPWGGDDLLYVWKWPTQYIFDRWNYLY